MGKKVEISKSEFEREHKRIDHVLRKGAKKEREDEARKQRKEVNDRKRGK
jgi:hypothetical protein